MPREPPTRGDPDPPEWQLWGFALSWFGMALAAAFYAPTPLWKVGATGAFLVLGVVTLDSIAD